MFPTMKGKTETPISFERNDRLSIWKLCRNALYNGYKFCKKHINGPSLLGVDIRVERWNNFSRKRKSLPFRKNPFHSGSCSRPWREKRKRLYLLNGMTDYQSENCVGMPCIMATSFVKSILTARHSLGSISVSEGETILGRVLLSNRAPSVGRPGRTHQADFVLRKIWKFEKNKI